MIALKATSVSWSWLYLFNTSKTAGSALDKDDRAIARGIARRAGVGPYLPTCALVEGPIQLGGSVEIDVENERSHDKQSELIAL